MPEFTLNRDAVLGQPLGRVFTPYERVQIDPEDERVVLDVALATDTPMYQWFGAYVILDMKPSSIRLDRMKASGAALWCHDRPQHVGRWLNFRVDKGKLRADCKFSKSVQGSEKLQDVKDEVLVTTSIGFSMYELDAEIDPRTNEQMVIETTPVFRCTDYEPFETSWEPVPLDIGAGTNRALTDEQINTIVQRAILSATQRNSTNEERTMPKENENPNPQNPANPANTETAVVETRSAEDIAADNRLVAAKRVAEWGGVLGADAAHVTEYIRTLPLTETPTETGLRDYLKAKQTPSTEIPVADPTDAATRQGGEPGIHLAVSVPRAGAVTSFDRGNREANLRAAYDFGSWALATIFRGYAKDRDGNPENGGIFTKATRYATEHGLVHPGIIRALSEGVNPKGGYLVPDEISNDIIDLILKYGVFRRDANVVQMKSDTLYIPRFVSGPDVYFVNESQEITESDLTFDQIGVFAKKLAALVVWSSELDEDAVIDIGNMVADKAGRAFAKREDECGFLGTGSAYYGGMVGLGPTFTALGAGTIANVAGVQVASGNLYSEVLINDFIGLMGRMVDYEGSSDDRMKWYMSRGFYYNVAIKLQLAASGNSASDFEDRRGQMFLGYPVEFVSVLPSTEANSQYVAFFGDLKAAATMGVRRGFTFNESEHVRFRFDDTVGKATERFGITIHSIGNASATAADRLAGPIGALQLAAS